MTEQERIILSAYTGYLLCDFSKVHRYVEEKLGRPIWTHEFASDELFKEIQEKCHDDFIALSDMRCKLELISKDIIRKQDAIDSLFPLKSKYVLEPIKDAVVAECIKEIDKVQTIESRPTGEWIDHSEDGYAECPFCHEATNCDDNIEELHYCWSCGAELSACMRGKE